MGSVNSPCAVSGEVCGARRGMFWKEEPSPKERGRERHKGQRVGLAVLAVAVGGGRRGNRKREEHGLLDPMFVGTCLGVCGEAMGAGGEFHSELVLPCLP